MDDRIHLACEKCGAQIRAPRNVAGQRHSCPQCGSSVYIPTPEDELDILPLAAEDEADIEREKELQQERRRLDMQLAHESTGVDEGGSSAGAASRPSARGSVESLVLQYLTAMRDADLNKADNAMAGLKQHSKEARGLTERLISDQIPPPTMAKVPPGVYQGFLRNLLSKL